MVDCISYRIETSPESFDLLLAVLSELGADAFQEHEDALEAFLEGEDLLQKQTVIESYLIEHKLVFHKIEHQRKDWNAEWESNFTPYTIETKLIVRAPFHPGDPNYTEELIIFPKMAFGTGHHETTSMILSYIVDQDFSNKKSLTLVAVRASLEFLLPNIMQIKWFLLTMILYVSIIPRKICD